MRLWGQIWNGKKKIDVVNLIVRKETALNLIEAKGGVWHAPSFVFFFLYSFHQCFLFLFLKRRGNSREWGLRMYQKSPTWLKRKWDTWPSEVGLTGWEAWTASAFYWSGEANVSALHVKLNFTRISWYYQITIATIWNMIFWSYKYKGSLTGCFF